MILCLPGTSCLDRHTCDDVGKQNFDKLVCTNRNVYERWQNISNTCLVAYSSFVLIVPLLSTSYITRVRSVPTHTFNSVVHSRQNSLWYIVDTYLTILRPFLPNINLTGFSRLFLYCQSYRMCRKETIRTSALPDTFSKYVREGRVFKKISHLSFF